MPALARVVAMPYPGMRPFHVSEWDLFYGQEEAIDSLSELLDQRGFVAVMGESGCGKSSIVKAGLIPKLNGFGKKRRGPEWKFCTTKPRGAPIAELTRELAGAGLPVDPSSLWHSRALLDCARNNLQQGHRLLLVVDQFEELFRFHRDAKDARNEEAQDQAALFVKMLLATQQLDVPAGERVPVYVVLTMRSEYFGDCAAFPGLAEAVNAGSFLLPKMSRTQLESAIVEPALHCGLELENTLLQHLLNETEQAREDGLPLLQHALRRTWEAWRKRGGDDTLRLSDFEQKPDIPGTLDIEKHLNAHLDEVYFGLSKEDQVIASRVFKLLGEFDHKARLIRRPCLFREALASTGTASEDDLLRVINAFRDERQGRTFLSPPKPELDEDNQGASDDHQPEDPRLLLGFEPIDLVHEAILRRWHRCADWTKEEAEDAKTFQELVSAAKKAGTAPLVGRQLTNASKWWETFRPSEQWALRYSYSDNTSYNQARSYIENSRRRFRIRWLGISAAAVVLLLLIGLLVKQNIESELQTGMQKARADAKADDEAKAVDAEFRALAGKRQAEIERQNAAVSAASAFDGQQLAAERERQALIAETNARKSANQAAADRAKAQDAENRALEQGRLATEAKAQAEEAKAQAEEAKAQAEKLLAQSTIHDEVVNLVRQKDQSEALAYLAYALRLDNTSLAAKSWIFDLLVRDSSHAETAPFKTLQLRGAAAALSASFSADKRVVVGYRDNTAQIWTVDDDGGQIQVRLVGHAGLVNSAAFSPDGHRVVTASWDNTARIWDARTGKSLFTLGGPCGHKQPVASAAFSTDGHFVVTGSYDDTAMIWDADKGGNPLHVLREHKKPVTSAAFSPDGKRVVTASWDHTAIIWSTASGKPEGPTLHQDAQIYCAAFSPPDGRYIVTASADSTAIVWDAKSGLPVGSAMRHNGPVNFAAFSNNGDRVVTASDDTTARVWETATGTPIGAPLAHKDRVTSAAFSPNGLQVVTSSYDTMVKIWDVWFDFDAAQLGTLAEAAGEYAYNNENGHPPSLVPLKDQQVQQRLGALAGKSQGSSNTALLLRWYLSKSRQ